MRSEVSKEVVVVVVVVVAFFFLERVQIERVSVGWKV